MAMMVSGHKMRSIFEQYNIVNDDDRKRAAHLQQAYLEKQGDMGTVLGTIHDLDAKRGNHEPG